MYIFCSFEVLLEKHTFLTFSESVFTLQIKNTILFLIEAHFSKVRSSNPLDIKF